MGIPVEIISDLVRLPKVNAKQIQRSQILLQYLIYSSYCISAIFVQFIVVRFLMYWIVVALE